MAHRDPHVFGYPRARWRLTDLVDHFSTRCGWRVSTSTGVSCILRRMGIHYKRGRSHVHSPDALYAKKLAWIGQVKQLVAENLGCFVLVYLDECGVERQPDVGYNYEEAGSDAPHAT